MQNLMHQNKFTVKQNLFTKISVSITEHIMKFWGEDSFLLSINFKENFQSKRKTVNTQNIFKETLSINKKPCSRTDNAFMTPMLWNLLDLGTAIKDGVVSVKIAETKFVYKPLTKKRKITRNVGGR